MSHIWIRYVSRMNGSCLTYEWGMSHYKNESGMQGGEDPQDALSRKSFCAKKPLTIGLFCGKRPIKIRQTKTLHHRVHASSSPVPHAHI